MIEMKHHPSVLQSARYRRFSWRECICEFIDNSLDAGARNIEIVARKGKLLVKDDGVGCDDLEAMFAMGDYRPENSRIGRFGVGMKDAACWLWGKLRVKTATDEYKLRLDIDWDRVVRLDTLQLGEEDIDENDGPTGTELYFSNIQKVLFNHTQMVKNISWIYGPLIKRGLNITIRSGNRKTTGLNAYKVPPLSNVVNAEFTLYGRKVKLMAGVVQAGHHNEHQGFNFIYKDRVVQNNAAAAKGKSVAKVYGEVELSGEWEIGRNKTEFAANEMWFDLIEEINIRCKAIFEEAGKQVVLLETAELEYSVDAILSKHRRKQGKVKVQRRKAKRTRRGGHKTEPQSSRNGGKHKRAEKSQAGNTFDENGETQRVGYMHIHWSDAGPEEPIGACDFGGMILYLNKSHPFMARMKKANDTKEQCLTALWIIAVCVQEQSKQVRERLGIDYDSPLEAMSELLKTIAAEEALEN